MIQEIGRKIGLHVRLKNGLSDVLLAVEKFNIQVVQSFLLDESGRYVFLSEKLINKFIVQKKRIGFLYFVHAAYWSNLTDVHSKEFLSLCKETAIAENLLSDGIVIHIGATRARLSKNEQVAYIVEGINELLYQTNDIPLILENSPHAGRNFGGDFNDLALLLEKIEQKDRVKFCVDTAHAFVYGYNLANHQQLSDFILLLHNVFNNNNITLLHLNDTVHGCESQIDKHGIVGKGVLGAMVLKHCMNSNIFKNIPIILELPGDCSDDQMVLSLKDVQSWED